MKLIIDVLDDMHMALCRSKFLNLPITVEQSIIAEGIPLDDVVEKIEQAANRQTLVALGCSDISECQNHLQTSAAYTHCLQILTDALNKGGEFDDCN